jgi:hypothetical protein
VCRPEAFSLILVFLFNIWLHNNCIVSFLSFIYFCRQWTVEHELNFLSFAWHCISLRRRQSTAENVTHKSVLFVAQKPRPCAKPSWLYFATIVDRIVEGRLRQHGLHWGECLDLLLCIFSVFCSVFERLFYPTFHRRFCRAQYAFDAITYARLSISCEKHLTRTLGF